MKTPYCTALRVQRREVDQIKIAIGSAVERVGRLERKGAEIVRSVASEREVAATDWTLPENMYFARMRAERELVQREAAIADAKLDQLRAQAREVYGGMKAVEGAAERYRIEETRKLGAAEQIAADDRAAADFIATVRMLRARRDA